MRTERYGLGDIVRVTHFCGVRFDPPVQGIIVEVRGNGKYAVYYDRHAVGHYVDELDDPEEMHI